jgi:hypothetical protein
MKVDSLKNEVHQLLVLLTAVSQSKVAALQQSVEPCCVGVYCHRRCYCSGVVSHLVVSSDHLFRGADGEGLSWSLTAVTFKCLKLWLLHSDSGIDLLAEQFSRECEPVFSILPCLT